MRAYGKISGTEWTLSKFISFCYFGDADPALTGISYLPFPRAPGLEIEHMVIFTFFPFSVLSM